LAKRTHSSLKITKNRIPNKKTQIGETNRI
jgi:hypothetical protein